VLYHMVTFPMTLTDPKSGFEGHVIFEVGYLKPVLFRDEVTKEH